MNASSYVSWRLWSIVGAVVLVSIATAGCRSRDTRSPGTPFDAGRPTADGAVRDAATGGADATAGDAGGELPDAGTATDAGADTLEYDGEGCLTYPSASELCGFDSDSAICSFSVGCGTSTDLGQCRINCEMGTTVMCYTREHVACLRAAVASLSCTDLEDCGWIL
jgi:hypothetical protein